MYQDCIAYVFSIVRRYVVNDSDHPDVIQEIFARVFLSIGTFDTSKGDFKFWLRRVVINQCMQHHRKGKSAASLVSIHKVSEDNLQADDQIEQFSKADIEQLLNQMPEGYRQIFMLIIIDEYSHQEAGALLGISPETSRSQLSRAKSWLRKNLYNNELKTLANGL
ncbi:MAG TPA: sigma-70 family RNA polymerase sigma factor [Saprospiraceae bacterium]|nr:sigma-70 family RNA polymerase sigma factor [Saprospiraceae bacterium]HMQ84965.1 sigma-70 family RNA polymerase sigma factor [Saprospiraceae bacterium]